MNELVQATLQEDIYTEVPNMHEPSSGNSMVLVQYVTVWAGTGAIMLVEASEERFI